jgi:chemotaxis family two-component system response regulator Rcp1
MMRCVSRILLVEDNAGDARLVRIALAEKLPSARLSVVTDGEQALAALLGGGPPPNLVLLDLNLPRVSGHEVLAAVRASDDPAVRRVPLIVLSSSADPEDIERSYELGANAYIAKPADLDALYAVVEALARYWFSTVTLP